MFVKHGPQGPNDMLYASKLDGVLPGDEDSDMTPP